MEQSRGEQSRGGSTLTQSARGVRAGQRCLELVPGVWSPGKGGCEAEEQATRTIWDHVR
jgi:hypothetical protein